MSDCNAAPITRANIVKYVREDAIVADPILRLRAADRDGDRLFFLFAESEHDEKHFWLDELSGELFFRTPVRFDAPADADRNNIYESHVLVSDGEDDVPVRIRIIVQKVRDDDGPARVGLVALEDGSISVVGAFRPGAKIGVFLETQFLDEIVAGDDGFARFATPGLPSDLGPPLRLVIVDDEGESEVVLPSWYPEHTYGGTRFDDDLFGGVGAVVFGGAGDDRLTGLAPGVIADYSSPAGNFSVIISPEEVRVQDRTGAEGVDLLMGIERVGFADLEVDLGPYIRLLDQDPSVLAALVQLYVACFNRAPDIHGIAYWAMRFDEGVGMEEIARAFFGSPEFFALYGSTSSAEAFVARTYENVLGREPDPEGYRFWVDALASRELSPEAFLISFITAALWHCDPNDAQYVINRSIAGARFSFAAGLSDADLAQEVMNLVDQTAQSLQQAIDLIDREVDALVDDASQFVVQIVGVA
jgi:hypothetical protein